MFQCNQDDLPVIFREYQLDSKARLLFKIIVQSHHMQYFQQVKHEPPPSRDGMPLLSLVEHT